MIPSSPNWLYLLSRYSRRPMRSFLARIILLWPIVSDKECPFIALPARENWLSAHSFPTSFGRYCRGTCHRRRRIVSDLTHRAGDVYHRIHDVEERITTTTIFR